MTTFRKLSVLAIAALLVTGISGVSVVFGDTTPVNYIDVNFAPVTTTISYNYDFVTGILTPGTATTTSLAISNILLTVISDPTPPDPNNGATFFGTAKPEHFCATSGCDTVVYQQSVCGSGYPTCFSDNTFTFGGFVTRNMRGDTLNQLTYLASLYYIQYGCDGGGAPRFQVDMSNGRNIFVYFGTYPNFLDCTQNTWQPACPSIQCPTPNMATDTAGLRWDDSQLTCGTFYQTYSEAVACANSLGLTIVSISIVTDGGWIAPNAGTTNGQTFLFQKIQLNGVTRFP